ncbi:MAG TPA: hypothetical protein VK700_14570 [Steroidobacteraceae bacterium]|jgi:uncharacterized membrane protein|nr:hypothetical protein [Steroidobacteraceae bacterium]
MWRTVLLVGGLGMQWGASFASAPSDCMDSCAVLRSDAARLACFDQELERRKTPTPGRVCAVPAPAAPAATAPLPSPATSAAANPATKPIPPPPPLAASERPPRPQPISAQVVAIADASAGKVAITLDNGEVWEQVETREGFRVLLHHGVTITPGLFGSYLLTTDDHRTARVRRIR